uniref:Uncharacterized protein n=1 Tax=Amphimedon queenslandica TaxID=400682 RepID=A0A1X7VRR7_AMPQE
VVFHFLVGPPVLWILLLCCLEPSYPLKDQGRLLTRHPGAWGQQSLPLEDQVPLLDWDYQLLQSLIPLQP